VNDSEYAIIKKRLRVLTGLDLESYKEAQMRRRLEGYLTRVHAATWPDLLYRLEREPEELRRMRDFLTINVSSFFRDSRKWEELEQKILPNLLQRGAAMRVWSAGCSNGSEVYTLAMLLDQYPQAGAFRVLGTDIDDGSLQRARAGGPYVQEDIKDVHPAMLARYFRSEKSAYWVQPSLQQRVSFEKFDLFSTMASNRFDLVVCRNVLIYFTEEAKDRVIAGLVRSLRPGGILFIGATENISSAHVAGLERVGLSFYRKSQGEA
jgi:chemotaxis protein methyltransferase CheR